jgi:hypothetical protein
VTQHNRRQIERFLSLLSGEGAQTKPENTVVLSVISGTSFLALPKVSTGAVTALAGLARLFF